MSVNKKLISALLIPLLGGAWIHAAEFEVLDRLSVDGYTVLRGSADIPGGSFTVGGSTFMVRDGKVGIGTTGQGYGLEVIHTAGIHLSTTAAAGYGLYLNNVANIGIGTAAPEYTLHVLGGNGNGTIAQFSRAGEQSVQMWAGNGTYSGILSTGHLAFLSGGSFTPKMVLQDTGSVGIGTATPGGRLEVVGSGSVAPLIVSTGTAAASEVMRVNSSGNVGIGTTNPAANLDVAGEIKVGYSASACTLNIAGTLRWYDGHISVCNGSNWRQLDNQPPPTIASIIPASGIVTGGTAITITGTGFSPGLELSIGGALATSVVLTGTTQITATAPAGSAGTRDVKITNPDGQYIIGAFTYNPLPTIVGVSPASGSGQGGTPITITGTGFLTGAGVTIGGAAATSVTRLSDTQITATTYVSATSGVKDVTVTNPDSGSVVKSSGFTYTVYAEGGDISTTPDGLYRVHTFTTGTSDKAFRVITSGNVEVIVVAGGGGGGNDTQSGGGGGGGGAGGLINDPAFAVTAQSYTVTVGNGGTGNNSTGGAGGSGGNSVFSSLTAIGGGGGGNNYSSGGSLANGANGGSGGGGAYNSGSGGSGTLNQGHDGATPSGGPPTRVGGGGGAGAAGSGMNGGNGSQYSISGVATYYAGGGGAGDDSNRGSGGSGGGAQGKQGGDGCVGNAATANSGGGGGGNGADGCSTNSYGGSGGSGIVIIRYLK